MQQTCVTQLEHSGRERPNRSLKKKGATPGGIAPLNLQSDGRSVAVVAVLLACAALQQCDDAQPCTKEVQTMHILDSHKTLSGINAENEIRFHDVIEFLEKELQAQTADAAPVPA